MSPTREVTHNPHDLLCLLKADRIGRCAMNEVSMMCNIKENRFPYLVKTFSSC